MASMKIKIKIAIILLIILTIPTITTTSISTESLESILRLMSGHGNALFANAISTSDLLFDLLSLPSFTLLVPSDPTLFALDMTQTATFYLSVLRIHVLPQLLRLDNPLSLPDNSSIPTLLPSRELHLTRYPLRFDGVDVVLPGLYYSRDVAVHGLAGLIPFRPFNPPPPHPFESHWNRTVLRPVPKLRPVPFDTILPNISNGSVNRTDRTLRSPPPVTDNSTIISPGVNRKVLAPAPEPAFHDVHSPPEIAPASSRSNFAHPPAIDVSPEIAPFLSRSNLAHPPKTDVSPEIAPILSRSALSPSTAIDDSSRMAPVSVSLRLPWGAPMVMEMVSDENEERENSGTAESVTTDGHYASDPAGNDVPRHYTLHS